MQATCTADFLADKHIDAVYSSDLDRAYDTACAIAQRHGLTVHKVTNLREINGGDWEGRRFDDIYENDPAFRHWTQDVGTAVCTNGESVVQMLMRVRGAVEQIVKAHPNKSVCVVCHGTPIRALTCVLSDVSISLMNTVPWASNASVTVAEFTSPREGKIVAADLHEHLGSLSSSLPANV
jgi:probable phosphoglycerate mutase